VDMQQKNFVEPVSIGMCVTSCLVLINVHELSLLLAFVQNIGDSLNSLSYAQQHLL
jgi:hypothetical protein